MNPLFRQGVLALAGLIEQGQPIPGPRSKFWRNHGNPGIIEQTNMIVYAQDIVTGSAEFAQLQAKQALSDVFPEAFGDFQTGTFGPSNSQDATIWARVGVPIGGTTKFFSVKVDASWSTLMEDIDILLEDAIDDLVSAYAAFGGGKVGKPAILQVMVY